MTPLPANHAGIGVAFRSAMPKRVSQGSLAGYYISDGYNNPSSGAGCTSTPGVDIYIPPPKFDLEKGKLRWGGKWLTHRPGRYTILMPFGPPYYNYFHILESRFSEDEKAELIRFLLTLEHWENTPGEKEISAQEVWIRSLRDGPKFTEELDDMFALSWRERDIPSYNFVFPARFLPRWEETTDDLRLCQEETWVTSDEVLEEFQDVLEDLLDEIPDISDIILPSDESILFERSTTTSYIHSMKKTMPHWEASLQCNRFNTKELIGLRCVVPVYPGGIRDTIIADISANNSIRWLERSMRHILEYVPESAVTLYSNTFQSRLEDVVYTKGSHVLRDIKKCGITYNTKALFPIVKECLRKRIPDIRWNRFDIYSNMVIVDDDIEYQAQRGYGLGMANHTVTLCNIVVHRMARNALARQGKPFSLKAICGNDDEDVVIFGSRDHRNLAKEYMEIEHDIHGALGNLINTKKSVVKPFGLFYEQYNKPGWIEKEALVCNALACAYLAPNVRVAKHYIYSQSDRFNSSWARSSLRRLYEYWGNEFFDDSVELKIHFEVGGWLDTRSLGLKTTLRDIDSLCELGYSPRIISFAAETCRQFMKPPTPTYRSNGYVNNFLYEGPAKRADPRIQIYTLADEDLRWYYKRLTKFQRKYDTRISKYQSRVHPKAMKDDPRKIQVKFLSSEPWYAIPDSLAKEHFPPHEVRFDYKTELCMHGEDILVEMIRKEQGLPHDLIEEDANTSWDPKVPTCVNNTVIEVDLPTQMLASQFSNSGYLPILEYFSRHEAYPYCYWGLGRTRMPALPKSQKRSPLLRSLYKYKPPKRGIVICEEDIQEEDIQDTDYNLINYKIKQLAADLNLNYERPDSEPDDPYGNVEILDQNEDELDSLIALQQSGGFVTMLHDQNLINRTDALDFLGSDEEGGFSIFD